MKRELVLEISVTLRTLHSDVGQEFDPDGEEYVIVEYDDERHEIRVVDYGYRSREEAQLAINGIYQTSYRVLKPELNAADDEAQPRLPLSESQ